MPAVQNYGGRNGVSTVIKYVRLLCKIYVAYSSAIIAYINSSPAISTEQKEKVTAWLNLAVESCTILEQMSVTYEA